MFVCVVYSCLCRFGGFFVFEALEDVLLLLLLLLLLLVLLSLLLLLLLLLDESLLLDELLLESDSSPLDDSPSEPLDEFSLLCLVAWACFNCAAFARACFFMLFLRIVVLESLCKYLRFPVH